jgi:hypothetical protein
MTTCDDTTVLASCLQRLALSSMEQFFQRTVLPAIERTRAAGGSSVYVVCVAPGDADELQRLAWHHRCFCVPTPQQATVARQRTLDACSYEICWAAIHVCAV